MLSVEPPPPDPPCACEISQLKSSCSEGDERAYDKIGLQEGVDLSKSLPKFSIRDYVFGSRSKDIKTNWPFSPKNLQLCLKHGVKELLPPFQSIDSVKNRSFNNCTAETSSIDKENVSNSEGQHHGSGNCFTPAQLDNAGSNRKLTCDRVNIDLDGSERDKEHPLTNTHQSNFSEASGEKLEESESTNEPQVKKCRLIVKVWGGVDPSSNEDNPPNCAIFPEPMASKVCPVCKTFSSSSNTTLNAHIDQCLTMESTVKWNNANSRAIKHRIKPRKTRLMVDIYATAKPCTLEELDRRNGTSWAVTSSFPSQETAECDEVENQRVFPGSSKDNGDEGAVYIDANGKKVRILSKFNDKAPMSELEADPKLSKPFRGRRSKLLSIRKKRHHSQKPHKYLKPAPQSKKLCSSKTENVSKVRAHLSRNLVLRESGEKVKSLTMTSLKAEGQTTPNDSGTITKWACSKRSSIPKRCNRKESLLQVECNNSQELLAGSEQASLGDTYLERGCIQKTQDPSESPASSPESSKRMENSTSGAPISESYGHTSVRKKVGFSSFRSPVSVDRKKFLEPSKFNARQSRKDSTLGASCEDFASYRENCVPSPGKRPVEINTSSVQRSYCDVSSSPIESHCTFSSKATKFSSLRKHVLGVNSSSMHESKNKFHRKCLVHKKSEVPLSTKVVVSPEFKVREAENHSRAEEITCKSSLQRGGVLKIRKKRGASICQEEQSTVLKSTPECDSYDMNNDIDSSGNLGHTFDGMEYEREGIEAHMEETAFGLSLGVDVDGNGLNSSKASDPQFQCSGDEQERFYEDSHMGAELDSRDGPGNYSNEVYPILIPELPGSFLPSPRDMGLEDLQGNSSLTNIQFQSSEDNHDYVERDSSYSPISAISTLSNSTIARSDSKSPEKLSVGPYSAQDEMRSAESITPVSEVSNRQAKTINLDESKVIYEVGPSSFRNDQPCRCSWKDATSSVSLKYQESQRLRRRDMILNDLDRRADGLNSLPDATSLGDFPSSRSDKFILPIPKSAAAPVPLQVSADCALKPPIHGDCDSVSPSSSNPILRLMGKNLIVNKDDNASPRPKLQIISGVSAHNIQSGDFNSFHHVLHQNPHFGSHVPLNTSRTQSHTLAGMISSKNVGDGFTASMEPRQYKVGYSLPNDEDRLSNSLCTPLPFYMNNVVTTPVTQHQNANSSNNPMKEVIVIDDNAEGDAASSASANVPYSEGMKQAQVSPAGISIPITANYKPRHVNPFHTYQPQASSLYCGSPLVQTTGFPLSSHSRVNGIPSKWNYASEGPSVLPTSSLMASSSSAVHVRPPYYSQSFS